MSKCKYKEIADKLNKEEVEAYYKTHLPKDVAAYFNFDLIYFYRIFDYLGIKRRTVAENTEILFKYYDMTERNSKVSQGHIGKTVSEETIKKISGSNKGKKKHKNSGSFQEGHTPWNKNTKGLYSWSEEQKDKYYATLIKNKWYLKSKPEQELYQLLISLYGEDNVIRGYSSDKRYPFNCDFYIKSEDLFIELNRFWHHGPHPFDSNDINDLALLKIWEERAKNSKLYEAAIYTWTIRDQLKIKTAKENNLNYKLIY